MLTKRYLESRSPSWANQLASWLASKDVSPNTISLMSIFFAQMSVIGIILDWRFAPTLVIVGIILRLLCNLLDGMIAKQANTHSAVGPLFNEIPDRVSDTIFFVFIGYYANYPELGWACALFAGLTAYIRALGASLTGEHCHKGPMAKQHRMALLIIALALSQLAIYINPKLKDTILQVCLFICSFGCIATCINRYVHIYTTLKDAENLQDEL